MEKARSKHRQAATEIGRFFLVSLLGVILDIAIAYLLARAVGLPLWVAATIGFLCAAAVNYCIHEIWTFQAGSRSLSGGRAFKYLAASGLILACRVAVVFALERLLGGSFALLILICGAAASFFVNFALSKFFVFSSSPQDVDPMP